MTQKHLISGLPPEERGDLGDRFVSSLAAQRPELAAARIAAESLAALTTTLDRVDQSKSCKKPRLWEKLKAGPTGASAVFDEQATRGCPGGSGECASGKKQQPSGGFSFGFSFA